MNKLLLMVCGLLGAGVALADGLVITHDAVPFAVRGQALTLKAKVTGAETPEAVTLYYALFRDAAPFRVPMKATGLSYYVGTIEASLVSGVDSISYYIEAVDKNGSITETAWYDVPFRRAETKPAGLIMPSPQPAGPAAPAPVIPVSSARAASAPEDDEGSWKTPALIAGGAVLVLGGAYAISQSGGGGSDDSGGVGGGDDDGTDPADVQGTYNGTVTTCLTPTGGVASCESGSMSIVIDVNGVVFSESLRPGQQLTGNLSGSSFTLVSVSSAGGTNSTINFEGSVVGAKILGSVTGSTSDGGTYSGSFSANKQ